ncbi:MAG: UDP-N-acetylmuramate--L-alanine ligase [Bacilli bacterium]|nr:UDP-N-acetylmuramate--L-alanine ligase [Bacilli bacterium]
MTNLETIQKYKKIHMIGIGGVSMSGLAEHLTHYGFIITGSDAHESDNTKHLKALGINVQIGHHPEMISDADLIVYTAAIQENDLERQKALELKKEHMERSEFLGLITKCYKECICISGTHGKTTTTSMIATCFLEAEYDPTIEVGAYLKNIKGNNKTGNSDYFILEACEYVDSFLHFYPKTEIILNIDNDHLDYFKTIDNIKHSFQKFIQRLDNNGLVIANYDDENTVKVTKDIQSSLITYAIDHKADYQAKNIILNSYGYPTFECFKNDNYFFTFTLSVRGFHNILNALACIATCDYYQIDAKIIQKGLQNFTGANRRFEKIGEYQSIPVFDDYAHHPTEIKTTLNTSKEIPHHETWAIFEPHTYTRTEEHLKEFAKILAEFDHIILSEIYAARETNTTGISSKDLLKLIQEKNPNSIYLDSYDKIILYLKEHVRKDDIIVTIGAGPINQVGYQLIQK